MLTSGGLTSGGLVIGRDVSILGPGATNLAISGGGRSAQRLFTINSGATGLLAGLTIADGADGDLRNPGTLTLSHCAVSGHSAGGDGAGVLNSGNPSPLSVTKTHFNFRKHSEALQEVFGGFMGR